MFPAHISLVGATLCAPVKIAHKHGKAHMRRNGKHRAQNRRRQAVTHDVADVLKRGKAEGDKHRIDDTIEAIVKIRVSPGTPIEEDIFGALLHHRYY